MYMVPFNDFWEDFENPIDRFFDRFDLSKNFSNFKQYLFFIFCILLILYYITNLF